MDSGSLGCDKYRDAVHAYVDGELDGQEQVAIEAHLLECASCRGEYEQVRHVVDAVRGSKPLYTPAPFLSLKLQAVLARDRWKRVRARGILTMISAAAALAVITSLPSLRPPRFTAFAAETHRRYAAGSLQLGVTSERPAVVSEWLRRHLPFRLSLPNYPNQSGQHKSYSLVGARILPYEDQEVAYLAYTMNAHPISLLVTSASLAIPSGGQAFQSGKLVFYFSSERGLKLITWRDRGLSYALVSDVQVGGGESCVVCHGSESERGKFDNLLRLN